jgi:hypothetical protein
MDITEHLFREVAVYKIQRVAFQYIIDNGTRYFMTYYAWGLSIARHIQIRLLT